MAAWLETLVDWAQSQLGDREREALWSRGVSDEQIELFRLGYLDGELPELPKGDEFIEKYQRTHWLHDVFVLPLTNTLGQVKGLQLRHVDRERKGYSDFTPYEDEPILFGLAQAMPQVWETQSVWLVEGAFDLFPLQRVCPNVVPTLTNRLTEQFATLLRRLVTDIWLAWDMDPKGREAVWRAIREYRQDFEIHDVKFPRPLKLDGKGRVKDPSELWEVWGDARLGPYLQRQLDPYY